MANTGLAEPWFVGEDGYLAVKDQIKSVVYHPSLNVILVTTDPATVHVLDVTSGAIFHSSDLSVDAGSSINCAYLARQDRVVFTSDYAVGTRRDINGMLLLESALQLPVAKQDDLIRVELPLPDAVHLYQCLLSAELPGVDHAMDVLCLLDKEISEAQEATKHNQKLAKWATVCMKMSHAAVHTVFNGLLLELKRLQQKIPALPVVSALLDRLNYLVVNGQSDSSLYNNGSAAAERALMFSESTRRETFSKWPHFGYKWALPEPMAQAGFYYQPSTPGDDRAMCFTCNVCLVCWEPTDEPWSEHERHSPQCPFVKGEFTQNVPVSVTYATEPAQLHSDRNEKIECLSTSTSNKYIATSTAKGNIVVWNTSCQLKKHMAFDVNLQNSMIISRLGNVCQSSAAKQTIVVIVVAGNAEEATAEENLGDKSKTEAIYEELACKDVESQSVSTGISLPSQTITDSSKTLSPTVTSLSIIAGGASALQGTGSDNVLASASRTSDTTVVVRPSLVVGVFVRRDSVEAVRPETSFSSSSSTTVADAATASVAWHDADRSKFSEVQVLNQLNQAISAEPSVKIIESAPSTNERDEAGSSRRDADDVDAIVPCLLVYDISSAPPPTYGGRARHVAGANDTTTTTFQGTQVAKVTTATTEYGDNLSSAIQSFYSMKDVDMSDDDQDVQIIGVTHAGPTSPLAPKIINLTKYDAVKFMPSKEMKVVKETDAAGCDAAVTSSPLCRAAVPSTVAAGNIVQCVKFPAEVDGSQFVRCIVPTPDDCHILVVTSPMVLRDDDGGRSVSNDAAPWTGEHRSCLLVYRIVVDAGSTFVEPDPVSVVQFQSLDDAVVTATLLPQDVCQLSDDEDDDDGYGAGCVDGTAIQGAVAVTTHSGDVKIVSLVDLSILATLRSSGDDPYVSTTYCTSIDRLCASTRNGRLSFFVVGPRQRHPDEVDDGGYVAAEADACGASSSSPGATDQRTSVKPESLLVNRRLNVEVLTALHDLTQFENLLEKITINLPTCWTEIQQEQQQRKHPQHLHHQGEATRHTRTWRLQQDSNSWDEHLFELILPKPCCIGHIDLKFSLNPICTSVPGIHVTLLKQSLTGIGNSTAVQPGTAAATRQVGADARIDFSLPRCSDSDEADDDDGGPLLGCDYLESHRSEIVCGPVELANYVDLSGTQGIIPLSSVQLLKSKAKSFLIHVKSRSPNERTSSSGRAACGPNKNAADQSKVKSTGISGKTVSSSLVPGASDRLNKQKMENIKGCDWLQEISITVRKFSKSFVVHDRSQRIAMFEFVDFHERLLLASCGHDDMSTGGSTNKEYRQHLALDILSWIIAIQINYPCIVPQQSSSLMQTLQSNLVALVQSCLLQGDRSIAHKCAKLIALCLEYVKNCPDPDVAPTFNYTLQQALLDCLPFILTSYSAGALHWYFTLLNHVKCMDASATGERCIELLGDVARSYSSRVNPYHSLLRARYGLYGNPLEPEIFDVDPPALLTAPAAATNGSSYAGIVASTIGPAAPGNIQSAGGIPVGTAVGVGGGGGGMIGIGMGGAGASNLLYSHTSDDVLFKDLMSLCNAADKVGGAGASSSTAVGSSTARSVNEDQFSRYLSGLLEVEPLHFTCHATSDGTRMERLDTTVNQATTLQGNPVSLSGTINFGEGLSSATGTMLSSLSSAMVSAEQQLQQLQQKQLQLIKLQQQKQKLEQKLAETSKNAGAGGSGVIGLASSHYVPYTSELFPPTPKNTPFFMTPPVTPPNESYHGMMLVGGGGGGGGGVGMNSLSFAFGNDKEADKPPTGKIVNNNASKTSSDKNETNQHKMAVLWPQTQTLFQSPPAQALVIERMHSARRFVVLDFGKAILLTDVVVPLCGDLASLSIDIWVEGEETDGHRLVVSSDIGISSLIMNDIMPPPICRYLKITTIRRYGGNTTRSKIPIGSFYGHTFILPWERIRLAHPSSSCAVPSTSEASGPGTSADGGGANVHGDQSQILSQLGMYMSLLEDVHCRYSLACKNLVMLLSATNAATGGNHGNHNKFFLKRGRRSEDDNKIYAAYYECTQLQVQLNLAKHASTRLQKVLGIYAYPSTTFDPTPNNVSTILRQTSVDKLRVLIEFLLDTVLSMTHACPTIPKTPVSLYSSLGPTFAETLFKNLCIHGSKKMQTHAGIILVHVCGTQGWWGDFLGNVLQEFFTAEQRTIFPQDRVFILLTALGQRSLSGPAAGSILESVLGLLTRQLSPFVSQSEQPRRSGLLHLDLTLIGWLLLFLGKCLDCSQSSNSDDADKSRDKEGKWSFPGSSTTSSRWNFIQGEGALQANRFSKSNPSKLYRRKLQKRLLHHKQQLIDLQQAKKHLSSKMEKTMASSGLLDKETEHLIKTQDMLFKRQLKQYSSKHLKDIINIRRTDGELLRKQNLRDGAGAAASSQNGEKDLWEGDADLSVLVVSRERCIPVVRGLVSLLLSMDFTCHVDLFIIACKVLARVTVSTRPAISLSDAMNQDELERLLLLMCNVEYNHGNVSWGGSWAGHSITCLLQDILEGERYFSSANQTDIAAADADLAPPSITSLDESLMQSCTLPTMEEEQSTDDTTAPEITQQSKAMMSDSGKYDVDMVLLVDALMDDELNDEPTTTTTTSNAKYPNMKDYLFADQMFKGEWTPKVMNITMKSCPNSSTIHWGYSGNAMFGEDEKKDLKLLKSKMTHLSRPMNAAPHGISMAMDARLEQGVELRAELRLKLMLSMESNNVQNAINAPLSMLRINTGPKVAPSLSADEQLLSDDAAAGRQQETMSSLTMLSICFNDLFTQLHLRRVNLDVLLQTWLTLNDDSSSDENSPQGFDPTRIPNIALNEDAAASLLSALAWSPSVSARTWVLAFQTLTLMANIKYLGEENVGAQGGAIAESTDVLLEKYLASVIITDGNLMNVLIKFLSGPSQQTPATSIVQNSHIGPIVVQSFHEFLVRLELRCGPDEDRLKEMLLRLVYSLSTEGGAFHLLLGPLDAQYRLIEDLCDLTFESVDVHSAIVIVESITALVHRHIVGQERAQCRSTTENGVNARSCYVGLFSSMIHTSENKAMTADANHDLLMCSLLKLVGLLVKVPLPPRRQASSSSFRKQPTTGNVDRDLADVVILRGATQEGGAAANVVVDSPLTDVGAGGGAVMTSTPNVPKDGATDEEKTETAKSSGAMMPNGCAVAVVAPVMSLKHPRPCSHRAYAASKQVRAEPKPATLADIVLGHRQIMSHLIEALGCCNTNTIAMILASSGLHGGGARHESASSPFTGENPLSVGDGIFHILMTLNGKASDLRLVVRPVYEYLSSELQGFGPSVRVSRLSEPLLWFVLRVLDCHDAIHCFLELGGIEVICHNLISANRHIIDTSPSLVSAIMQYFGAARPSSGTASRRSLMSSDSSDLLQNFAPLGTITSVSPTAGPADVLIQGTAPHRRARSAAWSYHFYPDEAWVDLTITLPCAVLLKEVNIQPHLTSLATCPAAVTLEGSRDGVNMVPISPPTSTSGLTNIKIQLMREEVVSAVTIRLHKPRDSHTIGLSQITLMGYMAFGDNGTLRASSVSSPPEDYVSRTSIGWLRLLHHCLSQCEELRRDVTQAAVSMPDLLVTCTTLMMTSSAVIYANNIESVLLTIGLHSTEMGLSLIDRLLRNVALNGRDGDVNNTSFGIQHGRANESTVDILYQLGTNQDAGLTARLKAITDWLGDCARVAIQKSHGVSDDVFLCQGGSTYGGHPSSNVNIPSPAVVHVQCIATILWFNNDKAVTDDVKRIVTKDLLSSMYEWSMALVSDSLLKQAVDCVICSICYVQPTFFSLLLEWTGVVGIGDMESFTDDHKDIQQNLGPLTDDLKASSEAATRTSSSSVPRHPRLPPDYRSAFVAQDIGRLVLEEGHLSTLASACQSPAALRQLLDSGFVMMLCQGLYEMSTRELRQRDEQLMTLSEASTDSVKMAMDVGSSVHATTTTTATLTGLQQTFPDGGGQATFVDELQSTTTGSLMTADIVSPTLKFLAEISHEVTMKDWLGGPEGRIFWNVLLKSLCTSSTYALMRTSQKIMTNEQRSVIETATVDFFSKVISCHAENQLQFSLVLHEVIQSCDNGSKGCPSPLPGFLRRLFLQVLLEDEKLLVCISSRSQMYKGHVGVPLAIQHPRFGVGYKFRTFVVSLQSTCGEVLSKVSETHSLTSSQSIEDQEKVMEEFKKDVSELGIEVIDQISALADLKVKEKRDKDLTSASLRLAGRAGTRAFSDQAGSPVQTTILALFHDVLTDQPLPSELNLSQLLSVLNDHGTPHGQTFVSLSIKQTTTTTIRSSDDNKGNLRNGVETTTTHETDHSTPIPDSVLLQTPNFTSALQVFSSIGGLALLAEHLPLLYPEFSRQAGPIDVSKDAPIPGGVGHDWVTVESAEEIYEEIYEPAMPPSPPIQHKTASMSSAQVLSIPPHSLVAFGLFLRLPSYAEVLLKDKRKAQCLLRLVLGVTDDGDGGHILTSPIATSLPSLPFNVLKSLFDSTPLTTDDGVMLRRMALEIGAMHLILACLSVLGHHAPRQQIPGLYQDIIKAAMQSTQSVSTVTTQQKSTTEEKSQNYWAKGTGFGTGSTTSSWDAEHALLRQKSEEEHVTCLLQVLASYINPGGQVAQSLIVPECNSSFEEDSDEDRHQQQQQRASSSPLPLLLPELLSQSCLVPALSSYLRNDSVLDMACHVPLYRALLELLRAMAVCPLLVPLLLPLDRDEESVASVSSLLDKMKQCVDTYASRLRGNKPKAKPTNKQDDDESEGLALLIPDIQETAFIVSSAVEKIIEKPAYHESFDGRLSEPASSMLGRMNQSEEESYMSIIKQLQFDTFKMVLDDNNAVQFVVPHHYESNVKAAGDVNNAARARRLAQEAVTLSTSLPLSASSSVFVRCDEERLDVMKVLMTGPADTPYGNGCFEFDVYFPTDYPNSPPLINLETTGNHMVRFNPNLYNDGKVCLSVLNTWHGRPEEKWNSQTSSFLQVLVSIQSLILVSEPYFNEPGYERSRGTPSGTASSREYDANIRQATVKFAMLEMLRNPPACFKSVIQWHFWLKRNEILSQVEEWIVDMDNYSNDKRVGRSIAHSCIALKRHYNQLKEELSKLKPPSDAAEDNTTTTTATMATETTTTFPMKETTMTTAQEEMSNGINNASSTETESSSMSTDSQNNHSFH